MRIAGELLRDVDEVDVIGVAPASQVHEPDAITVMAEGQARLDRNHGGFVLTRGEGWGSESETLFKLAEAAGGNGRAGAVVLANGGQIAAHEVSRFLEAGWPVVPLRGTGRAADELAVAWERSSRRSLVPMSRRTPR